MISSQYHLEFDDSDVFYYKEGFPLIQRYLCNKARFQCVSNCGDSIDGNVVQVLELYGFRGNRREVQQVKRFLLASEFRQVMKVAFGAKFDDGKKLQLIKDLLAFPKRSSKCQIHFL
ncbi:hypothetical protein CARUB_v10003256mg [Capsella rubella]|uniref:FBD domain-containing protein n=1 Tax=Capsella rubella TaxID=81985 RepID=R0HFQ4_9BRAS|nr:hypothetical protein CARUB_v10003256mg [Capsella rubella]